MACDSIKIPMPKKHEQMKGPPIEPIWLTLATNSWLVEPAAWPPDPTGNWKKIFSGEWVKHGNNYTVERLAMELANLFFYRDEILPLIDINQNKFPFFITLHCVLLTVAQISLNGEYSPPLLLWKFWRSNLAANGGEPS